MATDDGVLSALLMRGVRPSFSPFPYNVAFLCRQCIMIFRLWLNWMYTVVQSFSSCGGFIYLREHIIFVARKTLSGVIVIDNEDTRSRSRDS